MGNYCTCDSKAESIIEECDVCLGYGDSDDWEFENGTECSNCKGTGQIDYCPDCEKVRRQ